MITDTCLYDKYITMRVGCTEILDYIFRASRSSPPPNQLGLLCLYYFNEKNYNTIAQVICLLKIRDLSHDLLNTGIKVILFVNLANLTITQMNYISQSSECVIKHLILQSYHQLLDGRALMINSQMQGEVGGNLNILECSLEGEYKGCLPSPLEKLE